MVFTYTYNDQTIALPISFRSTRRSPSYVQMPKVQMKPAQLAKMERCKEFSDVHGSKMLTDISEKIKRDCCAENPNAFWKREKYFVSLPLDAQQKIKPMKASPRVMTPSEREFCKKEIAELLEK